MWIKSENGESTKPLTKELSGDTVILRKGFQFVEATEEMPAHWTYDEWQMTKEQYDVFSYCNDFIAAAM